METLWNLGPSNVARVGLYRLGLRTGLHPVLRVAGAAPTGPFFRDLGRLERVGLQPRAEWRGVVLGFGHVPIYCANGPPDWHSSLFGGCASSDAPWYKIGDFDPTAGDIKGIWEASRFDWTIAIAQRAALGDTSELERLNSWLADWSMNNPPYRGVNWKCGQEASIRVMHLAAAAMILDQVDDPEASLRELISIHLRRIRPTISYAVGQQNNHATSEAAALFIGATWLEQRGERTHSKTARTGRRHLEKLARLLIASDGSFSQYSVVYHRLMLDTYCLVETWRRRLRLEPFSQQTLDRLRAATLWLQQMVDPESGDAPNMGANDGARILAFTDASHRDFRDTLQWASALFLRSRAFEHEGTWNQPLRWLATDVPTPKLPSPGSTTFDEGGLHVLRKGHAVAYMRYPRFQFRPSQADALHVDLWIDGSNLLRDGGTFSYSSEAGEGDYFASTAAHNTIEFDHRDQMPRIGRFLFGAWLRPRGVQPVRCVGEAVEAGAGYSDNRGAEHHRSLRLEGGALICNDVISGNAQTAVLRWRLRPGDWRLDGRCITDGNVHIAFSFPCGGELKLVNGWESLLYFQRVPAPVIELTLEVPARVSTTIEFA